MNIPQLDIPAGEARVADYDPLTEVHGPGKRFAIWFQGCPILCPGCVNQDMLGESGGRNMRGTQLTSLIDRQVKGVTPISGITFMGGEPMTQASAVLGILQWCRENTNLNSILFSGYSIEALRKSNNASVNEVLNLLDVLIDGPYLEGKRSMRDIRGSSNQRIHHLNDKRLEGSDFTRQTVEYMIGATKNTAGVIQSGFSPEQIKI